MEYHTRWIFYIRVTSHSTCTHISNGFSAEIWDALRAAAEAEISLAQLIVDSAGVIVTSEDLSTCYDERGKNLQGVPVLLPPFASFLEINPSSKIT